MRSKSLIVLLAFFGLGLFHSSTFAAESHPGQVYVDQFWKAQSVEQRQAGREELIEAAPDVAALHRWLKIGPSFSPGVPTGEQALVRIAGDDLAFPYVVLIPDSYDPAVSYPVEFALHGGVSRPAWEPGNTGWWRAGFDSLKKEDRIMVVPAAWDEAFWWHENQADSIPSILRSVKRAYNVDDNRVSISGVSDGGTGVYFFAFKQPSEFAAFLPYIGHPAVLQNPQNINGGYTLYFENLTSKPLYIVNGENDPLYPVSSVMPFVNVLKEANIPHVFKAIPEGGHNTRWMPEEEPFIEQFKLDNPRDPSPERIRWVTDRTDRFNRNSWIRIDDLVAENRPGLLDVRKQDNIFTVSTDGVSQFTLLMNPDHVDLSQPVLVNLNGNTVHAGPVQQDADTLLDWAGELLDRTMLYTAELTFEVSP